jgi:CDP-diacylglycerol--serine O-phosphatidyltransferase
MACGFYAIIKALHAEYLTAAYFVIFAAIFDLVDGRVARMTKTTSAFGMQYDSLADLASFGLAPAVLLYRWGLESFGRVGWIAAFLYFVCGALRLARFNVQAASGQGGKQNFTGLPIPFAAATASSTVILHNYLGGDGATQSLLVLIMVFVLAFLMVSTIPFRSFKDFDLRARRSFQALVVMVMVALLILTNPAVMLFICTMTYISTGVFGEVWRAYRRATGKLPATNTTEHEPGAH